MAKIAQESRLNYSIVEAGLLQFDRNKAFTDLRAGLKIYKPDAKLLYACIGDGMTYQDLLRSTSIYRSPEEDEIKRIDYVFVYEYLRTYPNGMQEQMYWVECPMLYTPKSLNTFALYQKNGKLAEFFQDYMRSTMKVKPQIFNDYMTQMARLSIRPKMIDPKTKDRVQNPHYWKLPENSEKVIRAISQMSIMYCERG